MAQILTNPYEDAVVAALKLRDTLDRMVFVESVEHLANISPLPRKTLREYMALLNSTLHVLQLSYYQNDVSLASDETYDKMFRELQSLEEEFPELTPENSATQIVGH